MFLFLCQCMFAQECYKSTMYGEQELYQSVTLATFIIGFCAFFPLSSYLFCLGALAFMWHKHCTRWQTQMMIDADLEYIHIYISWCLSRLVLPITYIYGWHKVIIPYSTLCVAGIKTTAKEHKNRNKTTTRLYQECEQPPKTAAVHTYCR